jgi:hypothetical protein
MLLNSMAKHIARKSDQSVRPNPDIQIERWLIDHLIPRANNPRTHSRAQVASIAASMQELGLRANSVNFSLSAGSTVNGCLGRPVLTPPPDYPKPRIGAHVYFCNEFSNSAH